MVAIAVAAGTCGAIYNSQKDVRQDFAAIQASLDGALAAVFNKGFLFEARYPELARQTDGPYDTIITRVWKGDPPRVVGESEIRLKNR